ncbi:Serine/threonine-protein kinase 4 [Nowakowskiella sp. JEL0407]|nr:Serine/threonine-protein kinase 4 [Nowakowskiella sp. JEL0407]
MNGSSPDSPNTTSRTSLTLPRSSSETKASDKNLGVSRYATISAADYVQTIPFQTDLNTSNSSLPLKLEDYSSSSTSRFFKRAKRVLSYNRNHSKDSRTSVKEHSSVVYTIGGYAAVIPRYNTISTSKAQYSKNASLGESDISNNSDDNKNLDISRPFNITRTFSLDSNLTWISGKDPRELFEILEKLGEGAFGSVYKASLKQTGFILAVKEILLQRENDRKKIMKEIDTLKLLKNKNIVQYFGTVLVDSCIWILTDYCGAGSITDCMEISGTPFTEEQASVVLAAAVEGLVYLHQRGIVHRDVKCANILLTENGDVKIADFGVAEKLTENTDGMSLLIGTPYWMAPEVIQGHESGTQSDIWSLGISAIEMCQGLPPLSEMAPLRAMYKIPHLPSPTLDNEEGHSKEFLDFIAKCLEKDPAKRITAVQLMEHEFLKPIFESSIAGGGHVDRKLRKPLMDKVRLVMKNRRQMNENREETFRAVAMARLVGEWRNRSNKLYSTGTESFSNRGRDRRGVALSINTGANLVRSKSQAEKMDSLDGVRRRKMNGSETSRRKSAAHSYAEGSLLSPLTNTSKSIFRGLTMRIRATSPSLTLKTPSLRKARANSRSETPSTDEPGSPTESNGKTKLEFENMDGFDTMVVHRSEASESVDPGTSLGYAITPTQPETEGADKQENAVEDQESDELVSPISQNSIREYEVEYVEPEMVSTSELAINIVPPNPLLSPSMSPLSVSSSLTFGRGGSFGSTIGVREYGNSRTTSMGSVMSPQWKSSDSRDSRTVSVSSTTFSAQTARFSVGEDEFGMEHGENDQKRSRELSSGSMRRSVVYSAEVSRRESNSNEMSKEQLQQGPMSLKEQLSRFKQIQMSAKPTMNMEIANNREFYSGDEDEVKPSLGVVTYADGFSENGEETIKRRPRVSVHEIEEEDESLDGDVVPRRVSEPGHVEFAEVQLLPIPPVLGGKLLLPSQGIQKSRSLDTGLDKLVEEAEKISALAIESFKLEMEMEAREKYIRQQKLLRDSRRRATMGAAQKPDYENFSQIQA